MHQLAQSARLLVSDLASTLIFLIVLLVTKDLILAVAQGNKNANTLGRGIVVPNVKIQAVQRHSQPPVNGSSRFTTWTM